LVALDWMWTAVPVWWKQS